MAVAFDASVLIDLFNPRLKGDRRAKLDYLIAELQKKRTKILGLRRLYCEFFLNARESYFLN